MDIFRVKYIGRGLAKIICKCTGGELTSDFYRKYTKRIYNVDIGKYTYGSCFHSNFCSGGTVKIGRYCSIGNNVQYIGFNHPNDCISTSPIFFENYYTEQYGYTVDDTSKYQTLDIGHDVWIGVNVTILAGCHKIGTGAIIGAGSVVTKDVPPYAIVAGNPAHIIRYRFDVETIEALLKSQWWKLEPKDLMKEFPQIHNIEVFLSAIKETHNRL